MSQRLLLSLSVLFVLGLVIVPSCQVTTVATDPDAPVTLEPAQANRLAEVMTSQFCAKCHPAMYAEHNMNTHGRAFTDPEPRIATGRFAHSDCIRCHTPRPIFETGTGMNPMKRHHNLEEGNTCMTCHWQPNYDYARFEGGAECKTAFHPDVGTVDACAACHRNHGTPYQWEKSPLGKAKDRTCMDCHMQKVMRPVAVGAEPRLVRSHVFPGSRSESQLRKAYTYDAKVVGNEIVVRIENSGTGHNLPTELKQRSLESVIVVRDTDGKELYRSRMVFRDPYKRPYGLHLPVNTQIPSGQYREHKVPLRVASGTVQTELHFKLYFPIEDHHPDLSRQLEIRQLPFDDVTPSTREVETAPDVKVVTPDNISVSEASIPQLVDFARPPIGVTEVPIPEGDSPEDIKKLIDLFMFPVPAAQGMAVERLLEIGRPAVPALIETLGSWDNKTWKHGMKVLFRMGEDVRPDLMAAMESEQLYIRIHARNLLGDLGPVLDTAPLEVVLNKAMAMPNAMDRASAAEAAGRLVVRGCIPNLQELLEDQDPDVVRNSALALASLGDKGSIARIERALRAAPYKETRKDLAVALASLGSALGIPLLIEGLDDEDDLIREHFFEALFSVTGLHMGFNPMAPRHERLEAIARIAAWWARQGGPDRLRRPYRESKQDHKRAWGLLSKLGSTKESEARKDPQRMRDLISMGKRAVPALVLGLKFPAGFATRRSMILDCLGEIGDKDAAPFVMAALKDPVVWVADKAALALGKLKDAETLPALQVYTAHLRSMQAQDRFPRNAGSPDRYIARAAATRFLLGERAAREELVPLLLSSDAGARETAIEALKRVTGESRGYDATAGEESRRAAVRRWLNAR